MKISIKKNAWDAALEIRHDAVNIWADIQNSLITRLSYLDDSDQVPSGSKALLKEATIKLAGTYITLRSAIEDVERAMETIDPSAPRE